MESNAFKRQKIASLFMDTFVPIAKTLPNSCRDRKHISAKFNLKKKFYKEINRSNISFIELRFAKRNVYRKHFEYQGRRTVGFDKNGSIQQNIAVCGKL